MWTGRLIALPAALLSLMLLGGSIGIDKGELECEEAVKHLIDCCPDDAPARKINCYVERYCDKHPAELGPEQARCLRDRSCDDLYASGACEAPKSECLP
jgi:hypothetical protein